MRVSLKIFTLLIGILSFPMVANAACSNERTAELSRIAANVGTSYTYEFEEIGLVFTVMLTNVTNDIYVVNDNLNLLPRDAEGNYQFYDGTKVKFDIYSNDISCKGEKLLTQYVNLPIYNSFSMFEECKKYPSFKYCGMWEVASVTHEKFDRDLAEYIKKIEQSNKNTKEEKTFLEEITNFISKNIIILSAGTIIILGIIVYTTRVIVRKRRGKI